MGFWKNLARQRKTPEAAEAPIVVSPDDLEDTLFGGFANRIDPHFDWDTERFGRDDGG